MLPVSRVTLAITLVAMFAGLVYRKIYTSVNQLILADSYDFIIVGAGPAGCALANRLSSLSHVTVLLLEAGIDDAWANWLVNVPLSAPSNYLDSKTFWRDIGTQQQYAAKIHKHAMPPHPHGKVLGGSSAINLMIYARGSPADFNNWQQMHGALGWSWKDVEKYFRKIEDFHGSASDGMGKGGPVPITVAQPYHMIYQYLLNASKDLGIPINYNYNVNHLLGTSYTHSNILNGLRRNMATSYLRPIIHRPNLHVLTDAFVTKVISQNTSIVGVNFVRHGYSYSVNASREVLLCAGAYNSPHLLMLSGIGPKSHLMQKNVDVVADLPGVGENLHDHVAINENIFLDLNWTSITMSVYDFIRPKTIWDYLVYGAGVLSDNPFSLLTFLPSDPFNVTFCKDCKQTDIQTSIQILYSPAIIGGFDPMGNMYRVYEFLNLNSQTIKLYYNNSARPIGSTVAIIATNPKSRGSVRLASNEPFTRPVIDTSLLKDPEDKQMLRQGLKFIQSLTKTPTMSSLGAHLLDEKFPSRERFCKEHRPYTEKHLDCYVSSLASTVFHAVGTCKMGVDEMSVVDPRLRVYGVNNLRVVDASIMPTITSANTQGPTLMIAEKAADMIMEDHGLIAK